MNIKPKQNIIRSLEKRGEKIPSLESNFFKKKKENKLLEVKKIIGEKFFSEDYFNDLIEEGIEPITHICHNCFLVSSFKNHTFGVVNFKTKKIIIPCEFSDINFDIDTNPEEVKTSTINIFGETVDYIIKKDGLYLYDNNLKEKSETVKKIAKKNGLSTKKWVHIEDVDESALM